jgi:hypothetical protein
MSKIIKIPAGSRRGTFPEYEQVFPFHIQEEVIPKIGNWGDWCFRHEITVSDYWIIVPDDFSLLKQGIDEETGLELCP